MALNPLLSQLVQANKAQYATLPPTEQELFLDMLENTVTWEVHVGGQLRIMSEDGARLLSVHLPSQFEGSSDFIRVQRALNSLMAVLRKVENPTLALMAMEAGLTDVITRVAILEDAFACVKAEAA